MNRTRRKKVGAPSERAGPPRAEAGGGARETFRAFIRALEKIDGGSGDNGRAPFHSREGAR